MSGHSKWSTIKRQKGVADAKRSTVFTKLARQVTIAAKLGGKDPDMNFRLRLAIDKAKAANMPNDNIERAIKTGTGEGKTDQLKEVVYEGFGPSGVAVIVEATTDNSNRTAAEIRGLFTQRGGTFGAQNSVAWMFSRSGVLQVPLTTLGTQSVEDVELGLIDVGADDVREEDGSLIITTAPEKLREVRQWLLDHQLSPAEAELSFIPTTTVEVNDEARNTLYEFLEALDEHEDVTHVYSNDA